MILKSLQIVDLQQSQSEHQYFSILVVEKNSSNDVESACIFRSNSEKEIKAVAKNFKKNKACKVEIVKLY